MRRVSILWGAVVGALLGLPLTALAYLGNRVAGLPFIPFDLFEWASRVLPGRVVILSIETMVAAIRGLNLGATDTTAKLIEQALGIVLFLVVCALAGMLVTWTAMPARREAGPRRSFRSAGWAVGGLLLLVFLAIEWSAGFSASAVWAAVIWLAVLWLGWGRAAGAVMNRLAMPLAGDRDAEGAAATAAASQATEAAASRPAVAGEPRPAVNRRVFLLRVAGGAAGVALAAGGAGYLLGQAKEAAPSGPATAGTAAPGAATPPAPVAVAGVSVQATPVLPPAAPAVSSTASAFPAGGPTAAATLRDIIAPAPGTRPELTDNKDFYRIDIDLIPPDLKESSWSVEVKGLFDRPGRLALADLKAFPAVTQPITLSCISNPVAGDLISTSNWTGARLRDVLKSLGLKPQARALYLQAADGFYETVVHDDMMDPRTLLVYAMNGQPLPREHGFPLRIYIPNRYGMKQPKWITSMEALDHEPSGYWVDRGWSATAHPQIVSVIDTIARGSMSDGKIPIGGIAWAGDRGISKVEVQVDNGPWTEALLRTPPLSGLTWIQWRYDWPYKPGDHTFRVRATDGAGAPQIAVDADTFPVGATGYHSVTEHF